MTRTDSRRGRIALMVAHCAGMVDLVALPVWVGSLVQHYRFDPQQAGGLATLFLLGAVAASLALATRFGRLNGRWVAALGFGGSALAFGLLTQVQHYGAMAALHALAGLAAGSALSVTHGTIARSVNPHRLFALVGIALGVFAVVFLGGASQLVTARGGSTLFMLFAFVMVIATLTALVAFPVADAPPAVAAGTRPTAARGSAPISRAVWFGIAGICAMALVQSMTFAFLERVGRDRGFEAGAITGVLVALGLVNLLPAALAALLEKRWPARRVLLAGAAVQALLAATIMGSTGFVPYAGAASVFVAVMIFSHTFAFGLLARLEPSGRALAATPAMLMAGAAIGPVLGGTLVKAFGYGSLAVAAALVAAVALFCFSRLPSAPAAAAPRESLA